MPLISDQYRDNAATLVALCSCVNAHRDLEKMLATGDDAAIQDWIINQRAINSSVLNNLHRLFMNVVLAGNPEQALSESPSPCNSLQVGLQTLLCFGLSQWLAPNGNLQKLLASKALSDIEFCRTMHGIAVTTLYALGLRQEDVDDVAYRLVQLLSVYGHSELGIPARIDLRAHLLHAARGEPSLHTLKPFYRDHFFHAIQVCLLGHLLLETRLPNGKLLWELAAKNMGFGGNHKRVLQLWYLAALLHDVGYAMDVFEGSRKHIEFFRHFSPLADLTESVKDAVKKLSTEEVLKPLGLKPRDAEDSLGEDHGIAGAMHLYGLFNRVGLDDPSVNTSDYQPAIRAIALHNLRRQDQKASFAKEPLAFLLALCDQLQEWRRPRLTYSTAPNWFLGRLATGEGGPENLDGPFRRMILDLGACIDGDKVQPNIKIPGAGERPRLAITVIYGDGINKDNDIFNVWLDATLNFQRLGFAGLPLLINVEYITPAFKNNNGSTKQSQQLLRLRDAAHETHMSFLANWFPTQQNGNSCTNGAVTYAWDDSEELEHLTLDVEAATRQTLITRDMAFFWKQLAKWKHFNDGRDFPGDYADATPE